MGWVMLSEVHVSNGEVFHVGCPGWAVKEWTDMTFPSNSSYSIFSS